jgi:hypothetical protein
MQIIFVDWVRQGRMVSPTSGIRQVVVMHSHSENASQTPKRAQVWILGIRLKKDHKVARFCQE